MNVTIQEAKRMVKGHNLMVKDISGHNSYGYDYAIFRTETITEPIQYTRAIGEPLVTSTTIREDNTINKIGTRGAYRQMFNQVDIETLLNV